jgi:hypothetical protein
VDLNPSHILLAVVKVPPPIGYVKYKAQDVVSVWEYCPLQQGKTPGPVEISDSAVEGGDGDPQT